MIQFSHDSAKLRGAAVRGQMPFSLSGKTAIVTGGASGIGLAIAEVFGAAGADVHILDLAAPAISTAVEGCRRKGWKCTGHVCDVTVASRVNACFDAVCTNGRRCDVLVNNAGIGAVGTVEQATDAEMDR
jgi:NAD(P)-dependent dehydrogenase (short-subunit alcohol dehydrogenase family)